MAERVQINFNFIITSFNSEMIEKLKSDFRDFKINLISNDIEFKISKDAIKKFNNELSFIKSEFKNDIISGSLALSLWGIVDRRISDIDILIEDIDRYSGYRKTGYGDDEFGLISNRLGYIEFSWKKNFFSRRRYYEVDFFKNVGARYHQFEFDGALLKIQDPLDILNVKMYLANKTSNYGKFYSKHYYDLDKLFRIFTN